MVSAYDRNASSPSQWPVSDATGLLLHTTMDMREKIGRLAEGMETLQEHASETRTLLSSIGEKVVRLDHQVEQLKTRPSAPPPSASPSPASSSGNVTITAPSLHLAAMVLIAALGAIGVLSGAETKQALIGLVPGAK